MPGLLDRADGLADRGEYRQALVFYDQLVAADPHSEHLLTRRAVARRLSGDFSGALSDLNSAILYAPDNATAYWQRGACRSHRLSLTSDMWAPHREADLGLIVEDYGSALKRDPTNPVIWLATIEARLLCRDWDSAIGDYAVCQPHIKTDRLCVIRSWLGCLGMALAGDPIEFEDESPLHADSPRLRRTDWCVSEIEGLLTFLRETGYDNARMSTCVRIHNRFLGHFEETPAGAT